MKDKTCVLVTGGFDPLHEGHLALFRHAREYGDYLFVGVNSDKWLEPVSYTHLTLPTIYSV